MRDDNILAKLAEHEDPEEATGLFLYHGTVEEFEPSTLKGGSYDDVLWNSDNPAIAQTYIPESGGQQLVSVKSWRLNDKVTPTQHGSAYLAVRQMGFEAGDIDWDDTGRALSWRTPKGYPTYGDVLAWFREELGYHHETRGTDVCFWAKMALGNRFLRADHREPGRLFVVDGWRDLRFLDITKGRDGDLTDLDYHKHELFQKAQERGYDGIIIHDFAQTKHWGNLGHKSWGIFPSAVSKIRHTVIPCVHYEIPEDTAGMRRRTTPEFIEAWESARAAALTP